MKIYFSLPHGFSRIMNIELPYSLISFSGWGHLAEKLELKLTEAGCEITHHPEDADIEFIVSQPPFRLKPEIRPAVFLSMYETTVFPEFWGDCFNRFDAIVNPSEWGKKVFQDCGVNVPIHVVPLGVDKERFSFKKRDYPHPSGKWIYLAQGVQMNDRKGLKTVADFFFENRMPEDTYLVLKTVPHRDAGNIELGYNIHAQIERIQKKMSWDHLNILYSECYTSVNATSGEGFGFLIAEHMLSGMCVLFPNHSGCGQMLNPEFNREIKCYEQISPHYRHGMDYGIDEEDLYKNVIWTYEHQEEALAIGERASKWVAETFTFEKMADSLIKIFEYYIKTVPKKVREYRKTDKLTDWVNPEGLWSRTTERLIQIEKNKDKITA